MSTTEQEKPKVAFTLPEGMPEPKYALFQQVHYRKRTGMVVGVKWMSALDAIIQNVKGFGWTYEISFVYGKSPEAAFDAPDYGYEVFEDCLHPVVGEA